MKKMELIEISSNDDKGIPDHVREKMFAMGLDGLVKYYEKNPHKWQEDCEAIKKEEGYDPEEMLKGGDIYNG